MMKNPKYAAALLDAALAWYRTAKHDMGDSANALANAAVAMNASMDMPKVVCLCGSTKFKDAFLLAQLNETLGGSIVLTVGGFPYADKDKSPEDMFGRGNKLMLDVLHKRKIDIADEVYVLNVGGYVGSSTGSEVEYAMAHGKTLRWLEPDAIPEKYLQKPVVFGTEHTYSGDIVKVEDPAKADPAADAAEQLERMTGQEAPEQPTPTEQAQAELDRMTASAEPSKVFKLSLESEDADGEFYVKAVGDPHATLEAAVQAAKEDYEAEGNGLIEKTCVQFNQNYGTKTRWTTGDLGNFRYAIELVDA